MTALDQAAELYASAFVLLRDGNKVAFVLRANTGWMDGYYGLPAGKVEPYESFSAAAIREAKEEAGVDILPEHVHHAITVHRTYSNDQRGWVDVYFEVDEWKGEVFNAAPEEHSELAWFDINNLPDNVVPPQRFALSQLALGQSYGEFEE